jgi:benzoate/toluate 1,2-dioxygenase alpha subunit
MNKPVETQAFLNPNELVVDRPDDGTFLVSRRLFNEAELFELEMKYIFENTWLFLCHEGQIPNPGDFFTTEMGRQPVVISRGKDGKVHGFVNACAHRGATLCRTRKGNQQFLTCPYHGWVYDSTGKNVDIKDHASGAYPPVFEQQSHDLKAIPRLETYRGLVFGALNPDVPSLAEHLGGAAKAIDFVMDQSESPLEVLRGWSTYTHRGNWKLQPENGIDGYHFTAVHANYVGIMKRDAQRRAEKAAAAGGVQRSFGGDDLLKLKSGWYDYGHGHTLMWGSFGQPQNRPVWGRREQIAQRHGAAHAEWVVGRLRNLLIFPNLLLMDHAATQIRVIKPVSVDFTKVESYALAAREDGPEVRTRRIRQFEDFYNATGLATPDDLATFEACHDGLQGQLVPWQLGYDRGFSQARTGGDEESAAVGMDAEMSGPDFQDEVLLHGQYREWLRLMSPVLTG